MGFERDNSDNYLTYQIKNIGEAEIPHLGQKSPRRVEDFKGNKGKQQKRLLFIFPLKQALARV
mgnify:CR=1